MGDRCNVAIRTDNDGWVWLYSHWGGSHMPIRVLQAMKSDTARRRLGDPSYLCRILLDRLIHEHTDETGYGVSTGPIDDNYGAFIEVDAIQHMVRIRHLYQADVPNCKVIDQWHFSDFLNLEYLDWNGNTNVKE